MKKRVSEKTTNSLWTRWEIFHHTKPLISWGILAGILVFGAVVAGGVGYKFYDYAQHDPTFCITCHPIMNEAYDTWEASEHADSATCHSCHVLTPHNAINFAFYTAKGMPSEVPERPEGRIIVPDKHCMACHWTEEKQHGEASEWMAFAFPLPHPPEEVNKVSDSRFHALHFFMGPIACSTCHGQKRLHVSLTQPEDCLDCHEDWQEYQHSAKEVDIACMNCHTDRTADLNPDREKCLSCHSDDDTLREHLAAGGTIDVKYAWPSDDLIAAATKFVQVADAPMQDLSCDTCHQPHQENATPSKDSCLECHSKIKDVGQHTLHLNFFGGDCLQCHGPHSWKMTEEEAQQQCSRCHPYTEPERFIQSVKTGSSL